MKLQEIRTQYPEYSDLSDQQIADGLYSKHYSDMDRAEFDQKIGLTPAKPESKGIVGNLMDSVYSKDIAGGPASVGASFLKKTFAGGEDSIFGAYMYGNNQTAGAIRNTFNIVQGDMGDLQSQIERNNKAEKTDAMAAFEEALQSRTEEDDGFLAGIANVAGAAYEQPRGALHETIAQLPNSAAVMGGALVGAKTGAALGTMVFPGVGTTIGGIVGGIIGMYAGNTAIEAGFTVNEAGQDGMVTQDQADEALRQGAVKGAVITGVDAITFGLSRAIAGVPGRAVERAVTRKLADEGVDITSEAAIREAMANPKIAEEVLAVGAKSLTGVMSGAQRLGRGTVAFSLESVGEGSGEYLGSKAAGMEASPTDAVMEALMSVPQSAGEMLVAKETLETGRVTGIVQDAAGVNFDDAAEMRNAIDRIATADTVDDAIDAMDFELNKARSGESAEVKVPEFDRDLEIARLEDNVRAYQKRAQEAKDNGDLKAWRENTILANNAARELESFRGQEFNVEPPTLTEQVGPDGQPVNPQAQPGQDIPGVDFQTPEQLDEAKRRTVDFQKPGLTTSRLEPAAEQGSDIPGVEYPASTPRLTIESPEQADQRTSPIETIPFQKPALTTSRLEPGTANTPGEQIPAVDMPQSAPALSLAQRDEDVVLFVTDTNKKLDKIAKTSNNSEDLDEIMVAVTEGNQVLQGAIQQTMDQGSTPVLTDGSLTFTIAKSTRQPGKLQVTTFNETGALGDMTINSLDELSQTGVTSQSARLLSPSDAESRMSGIAAAEAKYQQGLADEKRRQQAERQKAIETAVNNAPTLAEARKALIEQFGEEFVTAREDTIKAASKAKAARKRKKISDKDPIMQAIAKLGGISTDYKTDITGDTINYMRQGGPVFRKTGTSPDDMAMLLSQDGFLTPEEMNDPKDNGGVNKLYELIRAEIAGRRKRYRAGSKFAEQQIYQEMDEMLEKREAEFDAYKEQQYDEIAQEYGEDAAAAVRQFDQDIADYNATLAAEITAEVESQLAAQEELENERLNQAAAEAEATADNEQAGQSPGSDSGSPRSQAEAVEGQQDDFQLNQQSEADLQKQAAIADAIKKADAKAQAKADADSQVSAFTLAGSNSPVDLAEARGQGNIFDQSPVAAPEAVSEPVQKSELAQATEAMKEVAAALKAQVESKSAPEKPGFVQKVESDIESIDEGRLSLDEFKSAFQYAVDNEDAITDELNRNFKKDDLLDMGGPIFAYRNKNERKAKIVDDLYDQYLTQFTRPAFKGDMMSFSYGMGGDYKAKKLKAYQEKVNSITQQDLNDHAASVAKRLADREQANSERIAGIENPETLSDYQNLINKLAEDAGVKTFAEARLLMPLEQRIEFDRLAAIESRGKRTFDKNAQKTRLQASSQTVDGEIIETTHTKKGHALFVVQLAERVSKEDYQALNASAKKLGGYYSSFRGNGAIPGFTFTERENAEAFRKLAGGDADQAKDVAEARRNAFIDDRSQSSVERLREMADAIEERGQESLGQERKANTARRARMAASAEAKAEAQIAMAQTMRNIANAIESGRVQMLDQVRTKAQIEMLDSFLYVSKGEAAREKFPGDYAKQQDFMHSRATAETADKAEFPRYVAWRSDLASLGRQLQEKDGTRLIGNRLMKAADDTSAQYEKWAKDNLNQVSIFTKADGSTAAFSTKKDALKSIQASNFSGEAIPLQVSKGNHVIIMSPSAAQKRGVWQGREDTKVYLSPDFAEELVTKLNRKSVDVPWILAAAYEKRKRLSSMNIETAAEFRAMMQEYVSLQENPEPPSKVKELERSMIGRRNDGLDFFPTPAAQADEMIETAGIEEGMSVLEPSAGWGHIADQLRQAGHEPDVIEMSGDRRELLEAKGYNIVGSNFLEFGSSDVQSEIDELSNQLDVLSQKYIEESGKGASRATLRSIDDQKQPLAERRDELRKVLKSTDKAQYDRIIMNPPFSDRRDAQHVQHAYSLLKPGGRLVAIVGEGIFFGSDKKAQAFRDWFESVGGTDEKLAEGTFNDPSLPVNTSVNARMIVIEKDDAPKFSRAAPIDTVEFKNWFLNSKVVDESGQPLVVYHGSPDARFMQGDATFKTPEQRILGSKKPGPFWFAKSKRAATTYADDRRAFDYQNSEPAVIPVYLSLQNPLIIDGKGASWRIAQKRGKTSDVVEQAMKNGHDGVIIRNVRDDYSSIEKKSANEATDTYAVFSSNQIKSVNNAGTFDPENPSILFQSAYHGSPYKFDRFSLSAIGTGEGAQAYGWGLYFAGNKSVADYYKATLSNQGAPGMAKQVIYAIEQRFSTEDLAQDALDLFAAEYVSNGGNLEQAIKDGYRTAKMLRSDGQTQEAKDIQDVVELAAEAKKAGAVFPTINPGNLYQADIPEDSELLDWDKPLSEQPESVQSALAKLTIPDKSIQALKNWGRVGADFLRGGEITGKGFYRILSEGGYGYMREVGTGDQAASAYLNSIGIPGLRYLDGSSRNSGKGSYNYVIWDESRVTVEAVNDQLVQAEKFSRGSADQLQKFPRSQSQTHAKILNRSLASYLGSEEWENAYEAVDVPDALSEYGQEIQTAFGRNVRFVAPTKQEFNVFNGIYLPRDPSSVYVNAQAEVNLTAIAGHEILHALKRDRPDIYEWFKGQAQEHIQNFDEYQAALNRTVQPGESLYTTSIAQEELLADFTGDAMADPSFLQKLADSSPEKFKGLMNAVIRLLNKAILKLRGLKSSKYINDVEALRNKLRDALTAYANGEPISNPEQDAPRFSASSPEFFSALYEAANGLKQAKGTGDQMLAMLKKQAGVKDEEIEWTGLGEFLAGKKSVTKQEIADYLADNLVQVETVELNDESPHERPDNPARVRETDDGDWDIVNDITGGWINGPFDSEEEALEYAATWWEEEDDFGSSEGRPSTKYASYQLPGGENYREVLLTLPDTQATGEYTFHSVLTGFSKFRFKSYQEAQEYKDDLIKKGSTIANELAIVKAPSADSYKSSHWDQPNVIAHIRLNDRTDADGNKVLFVEEIQSDWHQAGKKKGYGGKSEIKVRKDSSEDADDDTYEVIVGGATVGYVHAGTEAGAMFEARHKFGHSVLTDGVPNAPFKNNAWVELSIKKILRMAAEGGYDAVSWTTGEQQADRYDLSKQVKSVSVPTINEDSRAVRVDPIEGAAFRMMVSNEGVVDGYGSAGQFSGKTLDEVVGKEMAEKIMALTEPAAFSGDNLKVGGEGMKSFYDQILPSLFKKVARKLDKNASVSVSAIPIKQPQTFAYFADWMIENHPEVPQPQRQAEWERFSTSKYAQEFSKAAENSTQLSLEITPAMRDSALEGQPLFSKKGKPETLTLYHGASNSFDQYRLGRAGAVYFTPNQETAKSYGRNVKQAVITPKNMADLTNPASDAYQMAVRAFNEAGGWADNEDAMDGRASPDFDPEQDLTWEIFDNPDTGVSQVLRDAGYDVVKLQEYPGEESYAVFDTSVISQPSSRKQTDTSEFKRWFGNSKVVDENGEPRVVYHGTKSPDIEEFVGTRGVAGHFAYTPDEAESWAKSFRPHAQGADAQIIYPVYLKAEKPFDANNPDHLEAINVPRDFEKSLLNYRFLEDHLEEIQRAGFDAYIDYEGSAYEEPAGIAVFNSSQIKSAIGNNGNFDPSNPSILFSRANNSTDPNLDRIANRILATPKKHNLIDSIKETINKSGDEWGNWFRQGAIDQFDRIKRAEESMYGRLLDARDSAYKAAAFTKNSRTVIDSAMHDGALKYEDGGIDLVEGTKGLVKILEPLAEMGLLREWELWAAADRAKRLMREGRENLFTQEDIDAVLGAVTGDKQRLYRQVKMEWAKFNKRMLDFGQAAGLISPEERTLWENDDYVPFHRVYDQFDEKQAGPYRKGGLSGQRSGIEKLKGGVGQISIVESMVRNTAHMVDSSMKNVAMQRVIAMAEAMGVAEKVDDTRITEDEARTRLDAMGVEYTDRTLPAWTGLLAKHDARDGTVSVSINGKAERYIIHDPALMRAVTGLGPTGVEGIMKILRIPKRLLTELVTADPSFALRNLIRDTLSTGVTVHGTGRNVLAGAIKGIVDSYKESPAMKSMRAQGVGGGGFYDSSPEGARSHMERLSGEGSVSATVGDLWTAYKRILGTTEVANRLAVYEDTLKAGGSKAEAAYQAMDVLNFSRHGEWKAVRMIIELVPFMNARIQGLDRLHRGAKEGTTEWHQFNKSFMVKGALLMGATLALLAANWDDDRYWDLPEWERDTYYHFFVGDQHFRMPKPFEVGAIFSTIPERLFEQMRDDANMKLFGQRMLRMFADTFAFDPTPQIVKPAMEVAMNREGFTGNRIVSAGMEYASPEAQYNAYTSKTFIEMADAMPDSAPEWMRSPAKIEHLFRGYFGTLGGYVLMGSDFAVRQIADSPVRPELRIQDVPVVQSFIRDGVSSNKQVSRVYEMADSVSKIYTSIRKYQEEGRTDKAKQELEDNREKLQTRRGLNQATSAMSQISSQIKKIYDNPNMTPEQKRQQIDQLTIRRNEYAKQIEAMYRDYF